MKKRLLTIMLSVLVLMLVFVFVACDNTPDTTKHKVTFYDGNNVLKEVQVEDGATVESYVPSKDGYQFIDWYSTPSYGHKFDFSKAITEDVSVFGGFTLFTDDVRPFYVVGSGTSELLLGQDWGKNINESHRLTKVDGKNEYTITLDLLAGDEFQFASSSTWENKRGYGYLTTNKLADGTEAFAGEGGGFGEVSSKGRNIKVLKSGNYTFTLKTYPNEDTYNTADSTYTEANKAVYNVGTFDTIEFVRNGDPIVEKVVTVNYYIKGSMITNWADMYNQATTMSKAGSEYSLSVYLKEGDEFMFASYNSSADGVSAGSVYIKSNALDEASREILDGYSEGGSNMKAKKSGLYSFIYSNEVLKVTLDEDASMPAYDYYLDGKTQAGLNWKDSELVNNQLVESEENSGVYEIKNVVLVAGDELVIRSFEKGATPSYSNKLSDYNSSYLLPKLAATDSFSQVSATNANIKVLADGTYNISYNAYTKIITIASAEDVATAYVKGSAIEGWGNKPENGKMTLANGVFQIELAINEGDQIMIQYFAPGDDSEWGAAFSAKNVDEDASANFDLSGNNIVCSVAGTYIISFDPKAGSIEITAVVPEAKAYVKGSAIEGWGNKPESGKMTLNDGKFSYEITMNAGDEIMLQYFSLEDTSEWGASYVAKNVAAGDANVNFDLSGNNIKCVTAGTYIIVLDVEAGSISISAK